MSNNILGPSLANQNQNLFMLLNSIKKKLAECEEDFRDKKDTIKVLMVNIPLLEATNRSLRDKRDA